MQTIFAATACLPQGWTQNVRLTIDSGHLTAIDPGVEAQAGEHMRGGRVVDTRGGLRDGARDRAHWLNGVSE